MSVTLSGDQAGFLKALAARVVAATPAAAEAGGFAVEAEVKRQIQGGHARGTKTGAIPGGPPQNISGTLRRSVITTHPRLVGPGRAEVGVGPTVIYGRAVDQGHPRWKSGVKYPYLEPGFELAVGSGEALAAMTRVWIAAMKGV
jgi:hypothetical protein